MPLFDYTASDRSGSLTKGQVEARTKAGASRELSKQGLFVLEIQPAKAAKTTATSAKPEARPQATKSPTNDGPDPEVDKPLKRPQPRKPAPRPQQEEKPAGRRFFRPTWSALQRALYLRQLHVMFDAGIPIYKAASILTENSEYHPQVVALLEEVPKDLERGRMLSKSMARTRLFGKLVVSSVRLGEESGRLDDILAALADSEEKSVKLKRTLVSRLTYPVIVLVIMSIGLVVLGHVMSRVMSSLPNFKPEDVPLFGFVTRTFQHAGFIPLCLAVASLVGVMLWKTWNTPRWRIAVEGQILNLPVVGGLLKRLEANTVTSQISLLLQAGLPIDRGLALCADLVWTESFRQALLRSREELRSGSELGESFQAAGLFPDDVLALILAGELSGRLGDSLDKAAEYCSQQVERTLETAMALIEPLLIGFLGIAIGGVLICTFVPVFNSLKTF